MGDGLQHMLRIDFRNFKTCWNQLGVAGASGQDNGDAPCGRRRPKTSGAPVLSSAVRPVSSCRRFDLPRTPVKFWKNTVRAGMPILLLAAGQAGATSPASLAGSVVQEVAETLAGLVYVNLIEKGHPAIIGIWPFVSDLRTGAMSGGSGEQAILMAACGQMGRYYDLPTGIAAGMADSKLPDAQSGFEKGYTTSLAGHSGANMVYESAGMQASLLGVSMESFVIDNDMLGAVNRSVRGIEINDESMSVEVMRDVCVDGA